MFPGIHGPPATGEGGLGFKSDGYIWKKKCKKKWLLQNIKNNSKITKKYI